MDESNYQMHILHITNIFLCISVSVFVKFGIKVMFCILKQMLYIIIPIEFKPPEKALEIFLLWRISSHFSSFDTIWDKFLHFTLVLFLIPFSYCISISLKCVVYVSKLTDQFLTRDSSYIGCYLFIVIDTVICLYIAKQF